MEERVLLQSNCSLYRVTTKEELDTFSCGDKDLDDFFHREACLYDGQLLGKTYFFATERSGKDEIVCAFTLANDSIKAALIPNASRNRIQRKIPNSKRTRSYPSCKGQFITSRSCATRNSNFHLRKIRIY